MGVAPWLIGYRESEVLLLKVKEWVAMERKIPRLSARNVTIPAVQRLDCSVSNKKNDEGEEKVRKCSQSYIFSSILLDCSHDICEIISTCG